MHDPAAAGRLYLLYDGDCPLCCRFREWVEARDPSGTIEALDLDDPELSERLPGLDLPAARSQLTVLDERGNRFVGLAALRQLAARLPGLRRLDWIYGLPGVRVVASGLYRTVNRYRKRLCLRCGERWMPSMKTSVRRRRGRH